MILGLLPELEFRPKLSRRMPEFRPLRYFLIVPHDTLGVTPLPSFARHGELLRGCRDTQQVATTAATVRMNLLYNLISRAIS